MPVGVVFRHLNSCLEVQLGLIITWELLLIKEMLNEREFMIKSCIERDVLLLIL